MEKPQFNPAEPHLSTMAMIRHVQRNRQSGFLDGSRLEDSLLTAYHGAWWENAPDTFALLLGEVENLT